MFSLQGEVPDEERRARLWALRTACYSDNWLQHPRNTRTS